MTLPRTARYTGRWGTTHMVNKLILIAFMAVSTQCENWGGVYNVAPWGDYRHPRCIEVNTMFETKEELIAFLKNQDPRSYPHAKAYEVKQLLYDLEVKTKDQTRMQEIIETVETKREIKFK